MDVEQAALTPEELAALQHYMLSVSVPLLEDTDLGANPIGTGALFEVYGRRFLVTADHLFEKTDPTKIAVPLGRMAAPIKTLGTFVLAHSDKEKGPDVAIMELQDKGMVDEIAKHWTFLGPQHLGRSAPGYDHVVLGYPTDLAKAEENAIRQTPLALYSTRIDAPPEAELKEAPLAGWDLFFELQKEGMLQGSEMHEIPPLQGASGGPVFLIGADPEGLWTPEKVLKFVGVQSSALRGKWFRATSAEVIEAFLSKV
jgi:hypothetical protein